MLSMDRCLEDTVRRQLGAVFDVNSQAHQWWLVMIEDGY